MTKPDIIAYIRDMASELARMGREQSEPALEYLLQVAALEASNIVERDQTSAAADTRNRRKRASAVRPQAILLS